MHGGVDDGTLPPAASYVLVSGQKSKVVSLIVLVERREIPVTSDGTLM